MNDFIPLECSERLESIGRLVRTRRLEMKLRQKDLAVEVGLSAQTVARIEAGAANLEMRGYLLVLWRLGLLDEVLPVLTPAQPLPHLPEQRVRLSRPAKDDF